MHYRNSITHKQESIEQNTKRILIKGQNHMHNYLYKTIFITCSFLLAVSFVLIISPAKVHAAEPDLVDNQAIVNVLSVEPSTGVVTTLEASGQWRNGCVPEFDAVEITFGETGENGLLHITAVAEPEGLICGQSEVEWRFPIDVQFDLPGTYTVQMSITSEQLDSTELYTSNEIVVTDQTDVSSQASQVEYRVTPTTQVFDNFIYLPSIMQNN